MKIAKRDIKSIFQTRGLSTLTIYRSIYKPYYLRAYREPPAYNTPSNQNNKMSILHKGVC